MARTSRLPDGLHPLVAALLFVAALMIGLSGIASLPPDEHEILVLRSAHEMHARGDWVVPYFNDEPRLKKPPLSYWLTGLTAWAGGAEGKVEAWHGRLPSLLAGLAVLGMVLCAGRRFHGPRAALFAGATFTASVGFFNFTHDGRPDMLYAALCTAGWMAGAVGLVEARGTRRAPMLWMWAAFGLATLAKGPHVPAMLAAGMALYCWLRRDEGGPRPAALRPLTGLVLMALIALPWWLALHARIDPAAVKGSQLAGKLLRPSMSHLLNGYYLYRPLQLLLPWVPLAPLSWLALRGLRGPARDFTLFLALCAGAVALALSFGSQQRFFYMLPVLPALCLLTGIGLAELETRWPGWALALGALQALLILAAVGWLASRGHELPALLGMFAVVGAFCAWQGRQASRRLPALMLFGVVLVAAAFARHADGTALWSVARFQRHALATEVAARAPADQLLLSYALTPVIYIQVTGRGIPEVWSTEALSAAMRARGVRRAAVLALVKRRGELARHFAVRPIALMPVGANDRAGLFEVTLKGDSKTSSD